jgi:uncharacterized protein YdhG (YjbR/CyaY superfamily)
MPKKNYTSIDEYISGFPEDIRKILINLRRVIKESAPEAKEVISYGIPTFKLNGNLVHFGAFKDHIGFFPTPSAINVFKGELSPYKTSKGTVQFRLEKPLPFDLVARIVKYRVNEMAQSQSTPPGGSNV